MRHPGEYQTDEEMFDALLAEQTRDECCVVGHPQYPSGIAAVRLLRYEEPTGTQQVGRVVWHFEDDWQRIVADDRDRDGTAARTSIGVFLGEVERVKPVASIRYEAVK